jgi:hypothetical protein
MTRWKGSKKTENKGVLRVEEIVNDQGSIFRPIPQGLDVGIDGYIEFVENEFATGQLIAVQIKSGQSYVSKKGKGNDFLIPVDKEHVTYWRDHSFPVLMIGYSPKNKVAAWSYINDYLEVKRSKDKAFPKSIRISFNDTFDEKSLSEDISKIANMHSDRKLLISCVDACLIGNDKEKLSALSILSSHPDTMYSNILIHICKDLILDENIKVRALAVQILGYYTGMHRWSFYNGPSKAGELSDYAIEICSKLSLNEFICLIDIVQNAPNKPEIDYFERVTDIMMSHEEIAHILPSIAADPSLSFERRATALALFLGDEEELELREDLNDDPSLKDVYSYLVQLNK